MATAHLPRPVKMSMGQFKVLLEMLVKRERESESDPSRGETIVGKPKQEKANTELL